MVADKRSDIVVLPPPGQKLPIEVKRDTYKESDNDVWTACENQLERLYTRDPEASGYGIYVVFWFGDKRRLSLPTAPDTIGRVESAEEMELALRSLIPNERGHRSEAVVIDVSPP